SVASAARSAANPARARRESMRCGIRGRSGRRPSPAFYGVPKKTRPECAPRHRLHLLTGRYSPHKHDKTAGRQRICMEVSMGSTWGAFRVAAWVFAVVPLFAGLARAQGVTASEIVIGQTS